MRGVARVRVLAARRWRVVRWQPDAQVLVKMMSLGVPFMALPVTVVRDQPDDLTHWFADNAP